MKNKNLILNSKTGMISESLTLRLNFLAQKMIASGKKVVNLTAGELDFPTPKHIQKEIIKSVHLNKYTPTVGIYDLREKIAKMISRDYKMKVNAKNVAVTSGSKQALFESFFAVLEKGDEVILPSPYWVTYRHQIVLNDAKPVVVPLDENFDLDVEKIKRSISKKTKAIILNSPNNPTSVNYSSKSLLALKKILKGKNIYLVVDDIYGKIVYKKNYKSPAFFAPDKDLVILINGLSKSQALTGWRIGYVVANERIINAINDYQSHTSGNAPLLSQIAARKAIDRGDDTSKFLKVLNANRLKAFNILKTIPLISFKMPEGAFYFFIDISHLQKNSEKFCMDLLEEGLALVPGEAFGRSGFVRISFSANWIKIKEGLNIFKKFCEKIAKEKNE